MRDAGPARVILGCVAAHHGGTLRQREGRERSYEGRSGNGKGDGPEVKKLVGRYVPTLWLLAVLSLVGWFIWNGDLAGWILLALVIGLMVWQLAGRERPRRDHSRAEGPNGRGVHDESAP